jgi:phosphohistidine phosphatase
MMELILWRHAEAEIGEPDLGRKLTARGDKQARRVAEWLHAQLPDSARILVSPATRAQQTARALGEVSHRKLRTVGEIAPGADVRDVLRAADWPRAKVPVVVVGHQPTLGHVASFLLAGEVQDWSVKKAGVWWISSRERNGAEQTVLRAVISADLL